MPKKNPYQEGQRFFNGKNGLIHEYYYLCPSPFRKGYHILLQLPSSDPLLVHDDAFAGFRETKEEAHKQLIDWYMLCIHHQTMEMNGKGVGDGGLFMLKKQIEDHLNNGKKLYAAKAYRDHFGCSLMEAKQAVDDRVHTTWF